ncbi:MULTISPECIES: SH3 domain-containing protein [unclassified Rhizobium]|uniref:SH3 domain-containing protein n=1 Tax=unclassified Rhizobium TaxID=2613769 RepID=UPI001FCD5563|nr:MULTISPECIES: SH3 domain-containing protein [unclassified Rhizobium]
MALVTVLSPALAEAAEGYATANVNMRSGPSTAYPAVTVIPYGAPVEIHGCLADVPWCDVSFYNGRGWVAARYVQTEYRQNRVYLEPRYYRPLGIPTVTFSVGNYWDRYYRNRDFYRERDRWDRGPSQYDRNRPTWSRDRDRNQPDWNRDRNRDRDQPDWNRDNNRDRNNDRVDRDRNRDRDNVDRDRNRDRDQTRNRDQEAERRRFLEQFRDGETNDRRRRCTPGVENCP